MKVKMVFVFLFFPLAAFSSGWEPSVKFSIEGGNEIESLTWISGFAYAVTEHYRKWGCIDRDEYVGSKLMVAALNDKYGGGGVSSEDAAVFLTEKFLRKYSCFPAGGLRKNKQPQGK